MTSILGDYVNMAKCLINNDILGHDLKSKDPEAYNRIKELVPVVMISGWFSLGGFSIGAYAGAKLFDVTIALMIIHT